MEETRCEKCEDQYSQCYSCREKEKQTITCPQSGGTVLEINCKLKATDAKNDHCNTCGYHFQYP